MCSDRVDIGDSVRALSPALTDERGLLGGEESILIRRSKVAEKEKKPRVEQEHATLMELQAWSWEG